MPWRTPGEKARAVALSAAAIGAVYASGYLVVTTPALAGMSPSEVILELAPPASAGTYRDGTYTGTASNKFGSVSVAVSIASGRISRVEIIGSDTLYPRSYIDGLPDQVLNTQSADVPVVSGATASWEDFVQAVQRALREAAGASPGTTKGG
ncbi:FMN-binding protein [Nonomuraea turcica]|uniref:FMN-binding protein n=1 Tax=Nonomuraea sp. G32 TaxID=3067274 RepID=UPI00273B6934|nr:FMN-binding protein [Nonomuraea sp. G32]MDP4501832.1 FMN-binding protein [Nonomuraea sp. G32]